MSCERNQKYATMPRFLTWPPSCQARYKTSRWYKSCLFTNTNVHPVQLHWKKSRNSVMRHWSNVRSAGKTPWSNWCLRPAFGLKAVAGMKPILKPGKRKTVQEKILQSALPAPGIRLTLQRHLRNPREPALPAAPAPLPVLPIPPVRQARVKLALPEIGSQLSNYIHKCRNPLCELIIVAS